jgi:hypothetical protein
VTRISRNLRLIVSTFLAGASPAAGKNVRAIYDALFAVIVLSVRTRVGGEPAGSVEPGWVGGRP